LNSIKGKSFAARVGDFAKIVTLVAGLPVGAQVLSPPPSASGPGSTNYPCQGVYETVHGSGASQYWVFEPRNPQPASAPLIVFIPGHNIFDPSSYQAWIEHIVKRGNIVVFPRYQKSTSSPPPSAYDTNVATAAKNAIYWLQTSSTSTRPLTNRFAVVGHSVGGMLAANLAANAKSSKLPPLRAVMCTQPGVSSFVKLSPMNQIPANTLLLAVSSADDTIAGSADALRIYYESTKVPATNKDYVVVRHDDHGATPLTASHTAALATTDSTFPPDALNYYGFWKLFDGLCDTAFYGTNRKYALGGTTQECFMGFWSDGTPVNQLFSISQPTALNISVQQNQCILSWLAIDDDYTLQASTKLGADADWNKIVPTPFPVNYQCLVTQSVYNANCYYRLIRQ
jgi:surfactin synthase thioesterase subunit